MYIELKCGAFNAMARKFSMMYHEIFIGISVSCWVSYDWKLIGDKLNRVEVIQSVKSWCVNKDLCTKE